MSYCRWSTDDSKSDIYCYEDCSGGWTTHVAAKRYIYTTPLPTVIPFDTEHLEEWFDRSRKVREILDTFELVKIELPHAGETFNDPTAQETAGRLMMLREIGYNVPQYAIDELVSEGSD